MTINVRTFIIITIFVIFSHFTANWSYRKLSMRLFLEPSPLVFFFFFSKQQFLTSIFRNTNKDERASYWFHLPNTNLSSRMHSCPQSLHTTWQSIRSVICPSILHIVFESAAKSRWIYQQSWAVQFSMHPHFHDFPASSC